MSGTQKSVYTPVFYLSKGPTSPKRPEPKALIHYLDKLSRRHVALAQIAEDIPPSRPGSPDLEVSCGADITRRTGDEMLSEDQLKRIKRIESLRSKVLLAFDEAKRNPANGRWSDISQLLRTSCTAGRYRWSNGWKAPQDSARDPDPKSPWILAETEEEWDQWERRYEKKQHLKHRVHAWQQGVEPSEVEMEGTQPDEPQAPTKLKSSSKSTVGSQSSQPKQTSLYFKVSKRSSEILAAQASKPSDNSSEPQPNPTPMSIDTSRVISDISDMNFLPPSFPSQLPTSTPKMDGKVKVPEIPRVSGDSSQGLAARIDIPSPDFLSQQNNRWPSTADIPLPISQTPPKSPPASSLPHATSSPSLPSTPTKAPNDRKRKPSEDIDDTVLKKTKSMTINNEIVQPPSDDVAQPFRWPQIAALPMTPDKGNRVPTLTELLASRRKSPSKATRNARAEVENVPDKVSSPPAPPVDPPADMEVDVPLMDNFNPYDVDLSSPAKSLSSIAGSDSEDSDDEMPMPLPGFDDFKPPVTSTQADDVGMSQGFGGFGMYNSQYDVNGELDRVSELLERDVDFNGWLKDVSVVEDDDDDD